MEQCENAASLLASVREQEMQFERLTRALEEERRSVGPSGTLPRPLPTLQVTLSKPFTKQQGTPHHHPAISHPCSSSCPYLPAASLRALASVIVCIPRSMTINSSFTVAFIVILMTTIMFSFDEMQPSALFVCGWLLNVLQSRVKFPCMVLRSPSLCCHHTSTIVICSSLNDLVYLSWSFLTSACLFIVHVINPLFVGLSGMNVFNEEEFCLLFDPLLASWSMSHLSQKLTQHWNLLPLISVNRDNKPVQ